MAQEEYDQLAEALQQSMATSHAAETMDANMVEGLRQSAELTEECRAEEEQAARKKRAECRERAAEEKRLAKELRAEAAQRAELRAAALGREQNAAVDAWFASPPWEATRLPSRKGGQHL